jgi:hypothetical protein
MAPGRNFPPQARACVLNRIRDTGVTTTPVSRLRPVTYYPEARLNRRAFWLFRYLRQTTPRRCATVQTLPHIVAAVS